MNMTHLRVAAVCTALLAVSCSEAPLSGPNALHVPEQAAAVVSALNTPPTGSFRYTPVTRAGQAPLAFEVNMCRSIDPDVTDDLRFVVSWGDGTSDRGLCYLRHTYENPGRYDGRACVSDRVLGSPESCEDFVVDVVAETVPEKPLEVFLTQTRVFGVALNNSENVSGPFSSDISAADLASAKRIVVTFGTVTANTGTSGTLRVYMTGGVSVDSPANLGGQTGTLSAEIDPSQLPPGLNLRALEFEVSGGRFSVVNITISITLYR